MFKLINSYGNVIRYVNTEKEKDELAKKGYKLAPEKSVKQKKSPSE